MAENGEEKLLAVARHIAKTLGRNDNMADDILQIFSNFDGRFSREKLASDDERTRGCAALELNLKSLDRQISQYVAADQPVWSDSADAASFLDSIDDLIATVRDWTPMAVDKSVAVCLARAEDLMQQAMFRLEDEFRSLAERGGESLELGRAYRRQGELSFDSEEEEEEEEEIIVGDRQIPTAHPITDYDIVIDSLPSATVNDLHEIAKRMVAAGYGKECSHVHSGCRREFLEESLSRLGLRKLSIEEVQKTPWTDLEDEIDRWIKSANVLLRILFPSERRLCDRVFRGLSSAADLSFMEVCRGSTIQILNFADAVAIGSRSPERLFKILDVFETLRDLMPEFESLFSNQFCLLLRNEAVAIWKRLGEAIRGIFMELENLISRDPAKTPVPGGGLHPITRYVMNYLRAACRSRKTLEQVFADSAVPQQHKADDGDGASSSPMSVQMAWIMELLESNLVAKSKVYKDSALSYIFMMNNGRYIVQKVKDSELGSLLGADWIRKHTSKVKQYHANYQRNSWSKVLAVLKFDGGEPLAAKSMKEKLKLFSIYFDELCKTQSGWVVFDDQLREELRISIAKLVLPAYQSFVGRFTGVPEIGRHDKYIKYGSEDVEAKINDLFRGSRGSADNARK